MPQEPRDTSESPLDPPKRPNELPPGAVSDFDWMRALAAFAVLAGHVRGLYFVDYSDLRNPSVFAQVSYMVTGLGHQSVIVFFVLSGFFIGYSVLVARQTGRSNPRDYAIRRFARIYVVLVPALIATFLVDSLGIELFGTAGTVYGGEVNAPFLDLPNVPENSGLGAFLANLFQLQSILDFPEYGTNGPLWSLPYEAWAYAIFPLGLVAHVRPLRTGTVVRVLAVVGLFVLGGRLLCLYCTIWLMGAAVSWWWVCRTLRVRPRRGPSVSRLASRVGRVPRIDDHRPGQTARLASPRRPSAGCVHRPPQGRPAEATRGGAGRANRQSGCVARWVLLLPVPLPLPDGCLRPRSCSGS